MATLTEPTINIAFVQAAKKSLERSERGIVALILKDTAELTTRSYTVYSKDDIPTGLTEANKNYIEQALIGNVNAPSKVEVYVLASTAEDYTDALEYFEEKPFIYMAIPEIESGDVEDIETWIKNQRDVEKRNSYKLVIANSGSDYEGIINFCTDEVYVNDTTYTSTQFCARVAGMLAGTPITQSATYSAIPEATGCTKLGKSDRSAAVGAGKLICFWDGEKVKLNRAVTSLTTTDNEKGDAYKKIKIVETMDMIKDDITKLAVDEYFGKYANTYDNRCVLLSAICDYLTALGENVVQSFSIDFDIEAIKEYIKNNVSSLDANTMKDSELIRANTGTNVFLKGTISISDTIEDLTLQLVMEQ